MKRELYAVCPRCGNKARIVSHRWDWDAEQDYVRVKCTCGGSEVPYSENRVIQIDLNNPYMQQDHFDLLIPVGWDTDRYEMWNKIGKCLMLNWS